MINLFTKFDYHILPKSIQHFLMIDVYDKSSDLDKEFFDAFLLAGKAINSSINPIKSFWTIIQILLYVIRTN
jgi:hypothetical protein